MDLGYIDFKLNMIESKLDQIIAILHQPRAPRYKASSYSQSLDARGKEYVPTDPGTSGKFKYQADRENKA